MIIFKKTRNKSNEFDNTDITHEVDAQTLPEIIEAFEYFLRGAGFHWPENMSLDLVAEEFPEEPEN